MRRIFFLIFMIAAISLRANTYPSRSEGSFTGWSQKRLELLSFFLPANPVILQAGGHYGNETLSFAKHWPDSRVISFEPNPHAFQILSSQTENISNIQVYNLALNDYSGKAPFYVCYGSFGNDAAFEHASSLLKPSPSMAVHYQGPIVDVECVVLDQWCQENDMDRIDFMCLNLQGAELQVLKSSPQILEKVSCIAAHTFSYPFRIGITQYDELKSFLESCGFQLLTHWYREGLDGDAIFVKKTYFLNEATQDFLNNHKIDGKYKRYYEPFFKTYYDLEDDEDDSIKTNLKKGHTYEGNIGLIIDRLTKPGTLALDIGSHIGVHTVTMSRKAGPEGGVIAFEPNKKFYIELLNTLQLNHCENVFPIAKALGDSAGQVLLSTDFHHCPQVIKSDDCCSLAYGSQKPYSGDLVEMITLDSLNLKNLSLIKMDVENYEYFILKGAKETILRNRPVIIFECWINADYANSDLKKKANFDRVMALMESYGYEVRVIYACDFIAFPAEATNELASYRSEFKKLNINNFDLGLK